MRKIIANVMAASLLMQGAAFAQEPAEPFVAFTLEDCIRYGVCPAPPPPPLPPGVVVTEPYNSVLGWTGLITMGLGGLMMLPGWVSGETWELNHRNYCVHDSYRTINIDSGSCKPSEPLVKEGLITIAAGGVMAIMGWRRVTIGSQVSQSTVGASATVKW